jgi:hypothetical protein
MLSTAPVEELEFQFKIDEASSKTKTAVSNLCFKEEGEILNKLDEYES